MVAPGVGGGWQGHCASHPFVTAAQKPRGSHNQSQPSSQAGGKVVPGSSVVVEQSQVVVVVDVGSGGSQLTG